MVIKGHRIVEAADQAIVEECRTEVAVEDNKASALIAGHEHDSSVSCSSGKFLELASQFTSGVQGICAVSFHQLSFGNGANLFQ